MKLFAILTPFPRAARGLGIFLCVAVLQTCPAHGGPGGTAKASPSPAGTHGLGYGSESSSWAAIGCGLGVLFLLACRPRRHG